MSNILTYEARSRLCSNPTAIHLFQTIAYKQSNLAVALDTTSSQQLLRLADAVGPHICILKTHIDILKDFSADVVKQLTALAKKHQFLIFEDRKFADIGNTVMQQYQEGLYHIASWSDITNAHILPGLGIIEGLKKVGLPLGRGLLLLAQMSSKGSLATGSYTEAAVQMAIQHRDFVVGFIAQQKIVEDPTFIHLTPGVNLTKEGDTLGQNYQTPENIIGKKHSDVIIVGRGITEAQNPAGEAFLYQQSGWQAYLSRNQMMSTVKPL